MTQDALQTAQFPDFEPLSLSSRSKVERVVGKYPPYSDFNFVSLYSWNVDESIELSELNNNLVIKFKDYTSDDRFLSFVGEDDIDETLVTLLEYAPLNGYGDKLHLVPEHAIQLVKQPQQFVIAADPDSHDYMVLAAKFSELKGDAYASKRHGVNKFVNRYGEKIQQRHLHLDEKAIEDISRTFHDWHTLSGKPHEETKSELRALLRLLSSADHFNLQTLGVYVDDVMVAYSIYELQGTFAVGHFEKAVKSHPGLYDFLKHRTADELHKRGIKYINYEQDLGIEGLRKSKLLLHPETFLKKYSVSLAK